MKIQTVGEFTIEEQKKRTELYNGCRRVVEESNKELREYFKKKKGTKL